MNLVVERSWCFGSQEVFSVCCWSFRQVSSLAVPWYLVLIRGSPSRGTVASVHRLVAPRVSPSDQDWTGARPASHEPRHELVSLHTRYPRKKEHT